MKNLKKTNNYRTSSKRELAVYWASRNWFLILTSIFLLYVLLPFFAPLFMRLNWVVPANAIYTVYSYLCHQLPQRSFFLFGPKTMYSLVEIQSVWQNSTDPLILRQFIGSPQIGWKVAWSDRMVSMYTSIPLFATLWYVFRKRLKNLPLWGLVLFTVPMLIDGGSHFISDLSGIGKGFRDSNQWLAILTDFRFTSDFYSEDAIGSFNSWMRLITGTLFGLGIAWFSFPLIEEVFLDTAEYMEQRFQKLSSLKDETLDNLNTR